MEAGPSTVPLRSYPTPVSASISSASATDPPIVPETPWTGEVDPSDVKWFHQVQRPGRRAHPYQVVKLDLVRPSSSIYADEKQTRGEKTVSTDCKFFPWTGPWKPKRAQSSPHWENSEGLVAIAVETGVSKLLDVC